MVLSKLKLKSRGGVKDADKFSKIEIAITHRQMSHLDQIFAYTSFLIVYHVS